MIAFEIVDGGTGFLTCFLVRAHRVHGVARHEEHLEGDRGLIILSLIPAQRENLHGGHVRLL
ncbi:hypothetical protein ACFL3S_09115 [Gemmatimonadota bacterium]